ncbi:SSI family serine proteinase inhibitor [Modestobacter italicus]|uniref:SSI family serine proteinase inhibitor n=1 Tax=Modestobacter italicus (strain DSM 44449 / CECT 9708 / BC 501) TaxID=2732864 RepID=UPI001C969BAC|nr:SSI family serine proteinase inhibitor [Modestobacter italicus]
MRRLVVPVLLLAVPLLGACADGDQGQTAAGSTGPAASTGPGRSTSPATVSDPVPSGAGDDGRLVVELDPGEGGDVASYTLDCSGTPAGDLPDPAAACDHLQGLADPFAPLPADQVCTQQFGGPQTATITGRWAGEPVDLQLSRVDGCAIAQWDRLGPLLPVDVG